MEQTWLQQLETWQSIDTSCLCNASPEIVPKTSTASRPFISGLKFLLMTKNEQWRLKEIKSRNQFGKFGHSPDCHASRTSWHDCQVWFIISKDLHFLFAHLIIKTLFSFFFRCRTSYAMSRCVALPRERTLRSLWWAFDIVEQASADNISCKKNFSLHIFCLSSIAFQIKCFTKRCQNNQFIAVPPGIQMSIETENLLRSILWAAKASEDRVAARAHFVLGLS